MRVIAELLFWVAGAMLVYGFVGYPVLVWAWAGLRPRPVSRRRWEPSVTLLIIAHNEGARIDGRVANLVALDYPRHRLQLLVASDGSTDDTLARLSGWRHAGVQAVAFETRRGKPAVLNDAIPLARGEIVVLADARQQFEPEAVRALVAAFADPAVGAVSGELILARDPQVSAVGEGVGLYWRYEKWIRWSESRIDSTVRATGAILAIRRSLFEPIPEDTILDDVWLPMRIVRRGYRVLVEPGARARDRASATCAQEFTRKVRTLAGNLQLFARERWLLDPFRNRLWLQTASHALPRLLTPFLLLAALGADVCLAAGSPFHRWTLAGQIAFYAAALGGHRRRGAGRRILAVPYLVCFLAVAGLVAAARFVTGRQPVTWDKAAEATSPRAPDALVRRTS